MKVICEQITCIHNDKAIIYDKEILSGLCKSEMITIDKRNRKCESFTTGNKWKDKTEG